MTVASVAHALPLTQLEALPDLVAAVQPGVVHVEVESESGGGNGSGFAVRVHADDDVSCVIVTNAHVVALAERIIVRFYDDTEHRAKLRLQDDSTDLALLEVDADPIETLELRPTRDVRVGEPVIAMGSPYGMSGSVTMGIVSGLDRTGPGFNGVPIDNMIQTDALVNPGNSGGPLIGLDGRVIGVNSQSIIHFDHGSSGLSLAVPSDTVTMVYDETRESRASYIRRATLRASTVLRAFTFEERSTWGQRAGALLVESPHQGTPAERAGLRRGDVIVSFDGHVVDEPGDLYRLLKRSTIGQACKAEYIRDGERAVTLATPVERT